MKFEYFTVLAVCIIIPIIKSFNKQLNFYRNPSGLFLSITLPFIIFLIWDFYATMKGHWDFNPSYITGWKIFNLPIEEVLFFIVIPFCGIFTWEVVKYFYRRNQ